MTFAPRRNVPRASLVFLLLLLFVRLFGQNRVDWSAELLSEMMAEETDVEQSLVNRVYYLARDGMAMILYSFLHDRSEEQIGRLINQVRTSVRSKDLLSLRSVGLSSLPLSVIAGLCPERDNSSRLDRYHESFDIGIPAAVIVYYYYSLLYYYNNNNYYLLLLFIIISI